jgi:hypothetical protein
MAQAPAPSPFKFEFHGFASGTLWAQDGSWTGSGGSAIIVGLNQPTEDKLSFGADARQSRFNWSVTGPAVMRGATPKAVLEIDFFGGWTAGNVGNIHQLPRLRVAYAELNWAGANRIIFGQNYDLTAALGPVSLAHIGAPYFLSSGNMGFRRPGLFGYHTFGDLKAKDSMKVEFAWEVGRAQWTDAGTVGAGACTGLPGSGVGGSVGGVCAGEASGLPAVQARIAVSKGAQYSAFIAGHWNRVDRNGAGNTDSTAASTPIGQRPLDVIGGNIGGKAVFGPVTLAAAGYVGKNLAPLYGGISQSFYTTGGDVHEYGFWGQLGFNFTKELSIWGFAGQDKINDKDIPGSSFAIDRHTNFAGLLQYRDGGYALGLEYLHGRANYTAAGGAAGVTLANQGIKSANQLALTGIYYF